MPARLAVDWSGLRAAAIAIGNVSEAARQAAAKLPEEERERFREAVSKRAVREQWLESAKRSVAISTAKNPLSNLVQSGADVMADSLAEDSKETRLSLSRAARQLAKQAEDAPLKMAGEALQAGKLAALTHGWEQAGGSSVSINVLIQ